MVFPDICVITLPAALFLTITIENEYQILPKHTTLHIISTPNIKLEGPPDTGIIN